MSGISIHMSPARWRSSVTEQVQDLVCGLLVRRKKVPECGRIFEIGLRVALLRMYERRKLDTIADKENWCIIHHHIEVALLGVEFDRKTARIPCSVRRPLFPSHRAKANSNRCLLSDIGEKIR